MKSNKTKAIAAAALAATIVASFSTVSCQGRKMSNMEPKGETIEVYVADTDTITSP